MSAHAAAECLLGSAVSRPSSLIERNGTLPLRCRAVCFGVKNRPRRWQESSPNHGQLNKLYLRAETGFAEIGKAIYRA